MSPSRESKLVALGLGGGWGRKGAGKAGGGRAARTSCRWPDRWYVTLILTPPSPCQRPPTGVMILNEQPPPPPPPPVPYLCCSLLGGKHGRAIGRFRDATRRTIFESVSRVAHSSRAIVVRHDRSVRDSRERCFYSKRPFFCNFLEEFLDSYRSCDD